MKPFPSFTRSIAYSACLLGTTLTLGACQTFEGLKDDFAKIDFSSFTPAIVADPEDKHSNFLIDGDCPRIEVVDELSMLSEYTNPDNPNQSERISGVEIIKADSTCEYNDRSVTVDLKLTFNGNLGPQGKMTPSDTPFFSYPYFVAVTSPNDKILAKEIFAASMTYDANQNAKTYHETLRQIIPADNRTIGSRYKIMVGFQLTRDQLAENRAILEQRRLAEIARQEEIKKQAAAARAAEEAAKNAAEEQAKIQAQAAASAEPQITIEKTTPETQTNAGPFDLINN